LKLFLQVGRSGAEGFYLPGFAHMTTQLAATAAVPARDARWFLRRLWPIVIVIWMTRLALAACCNLLPDEAFYWTWTRHLSGGYLDHPPLIACLMWVATHVFGQHEWAVRLPSLLMSLASLLVVVSLSRRILHDDRAAGFVAMMWLASPLLAGIGLIFTPDTPAIFFSICGLACVALVLLNGEPPSQPFSRRAESILWILFGLFCGLAMLSKYTAVLLPAGLALSLITSSAGRRHLLGPWVYLAAVVALLVFSPVIYWNATHRWASFLFQLHHGAGEGITEGANGFLRRLLLRLGGLGEFLGGQALLWTPILFALTVVVLWVNWRNYFRLREVDRLLLWCGTLPLILFGWAATRSHGEMNWPAFAYFPLSILLARYLSENWAGNRVHLAREGCKLALVFLVALHLLALPGASKVFSRMHVTLPHNVTDLYGWREFGHELDQRAEGRQVVCNRHQDAGEAAFYMKGQPDVWCEDVGSRPTAYDYFDRGRPDYTRLDQVVFVGSHEEEFMTKFNYNRSLRMPTVEMPGPGKHRTRPVWLIERSR
jgi:4-amino-4-deoxy-L-arabinose transferase-like glycosyltransferase